MALAAQNASRYPVPGRSLIPSTILPDSRHLDELLLDAEGFCKPLPYAELAAIDKMTFIAWCYRHAIYQYPTAELIEFLEGHLFRGNNFYYNRDEVLEIGAGMGHVGRLLGIRQTDSAVQDTAQIREIYKGLGQKPTIPPPCVERLDAASAVAKYQPKVVLACWVTHKWIPGAGMQAGFEDGVEEEKILDAVAQYIHLGNFASHQYKPIRAMPHRVIYSPSADYPDGWLVTRSTQPEQNFCQIWRGARA